VFVCRLFYAADKAHVPYYISTCGLSLCRMFYIFPSTGAKKLNREGVS